MYSGGANAWTEPCGVRKSQPAGHRGRKLQQDRASELRDFVIANEHRHSITVTPQHSEAIRNDSFGKSNMENTDGMIVSNVI
jgi:hypothetical protein